MNAIETNQAALQQHLTYAAINFLVAMLAFYLVRVWAIRAVKIAAAKTKSKWDDAVVESRFFQALSWIVPLIFLQLGSKSYEGIQPQFGDIFQGILHSFWIVVGLKIFTRFLDAVLIIYRSTDRAKSHPIKGYIQLVKIFCFITCTILFISVVTGQSPWYLLSGLGALTAVLMLIFKDTLLSLVASIQITTQRLIRVGDWVEVPDYSADGDVIDVALHTITVQNWDKTVSLIPTSKVLEKGFKNWRSMSESGGRRIKRHINIDMSSVHFLELEEIESLRRIQILKPYLEQRIAEVESWNADHEIDLDHVVNGRRLTNLGVFREYIKTYLDQHQMVHSPGHMTFLVRQLQPTEKGLPLEIYVFSRDVRWVQYEEIQADILDHLVASVQEFGLAIFQEPSDLSFRSLAPPTH